MSLKKTLFTLSILLCNTTYTGDHEDLVYECRALVLSKIRSLKTQGVNPSQSLQEAERALNRFFPLEKMPMSTKKSRQEEQILELLKASREENKKQKNDQRLARIADREQKMKQAAAAAAKLADDKKRRAAAVVRDRALEISQYEKNKREIEDALAATRKMIRLKELEDERLKRMKAQDELEKMRDDEHLKKQKAWALQKKRSRQEERDRQEKVFQGNYKRYIEQMRSFSVVPKEKEEEGEDRLSKKVTALIRMQDAAGSNYRRGIDMKRYAHQARLATVGADGHREDDDSATLREKRGRLKLDVTVDIDNFA